MSLTASALAGLLVLLVPMIALWMVSLKQVDASIVDRVWGLTFVLLILVYAIARLAPLTELNTRQFVVLALVLVWGLRLSIYIHRRNRGHGEDRRYAAMRAAAGRAFAWSSLFKVFVLQAIVAWIVSAPLLLIMARPEPSGWTAFDTLGVGLWLLGFVFEAGSDAQLSRFKRDPENQGKLLTTGFFALCRHPNYFGDATLWWGYFAFALSVEGGVWTAFGPLLMTALIRYVSGVTLLDKDMSARKPGFAEYVARTPAFLPRPWPHS